MTTGSSSSSSYVTASDDCDYKASYEIWETSGSEAPPSPQTVRTSGPRPSAGHGCFGCWCRSVSITIADQTKPVISSVTGGTINLVPRGCDNHHFLGVRDGDNYGVGKFDLSPAPRMASSPARWTWCDDLAGINMPGAGCLRQHKCISSAASFAIQDVTGRRRPPPAQDIGFQRGIDGDAFRHLRLGQLCDELHL